MPNAQQVKAELQKSIEYVRARLYTMENATARELLRQYQVAFEAMQADLARVFAEQTTGGVWTMNDANAFRRTHSLVNQIADKMATLNQQAHDLIIADSIKAYRAGFFGHGWVADLVSPKDKAIRLPLLPDEAIRAAVMFPYEDNTQFFRLEAARLDFIKNIRQSIVQSQMRGETQAQARNRLADALGLDIGRKTKDQRLANNGAFYRMETIARTELNRSSNLGSAAVYAANKDLVKKYTFIATLDARTCAICGPLDGKEFPLSNTSNQPPKHPNCRCTTAPVAVSFKELGLSTAELGTFNRASMFGPVSGNLTYTEWAKQNKVGAYSDGGLQHLPPSKPPKSARAG